MELQSGLPSVLPPGPLSPTLDYAGPLSPSSGGPGPSHPSSPGRGPSPSLSPIRGPSPGPGLSGPAAFNYNQLEGRFKQLQGKNRLCGRHRTPAGPNRKSVRQLQVFRSAARQSSPVDGGSCVFFCEILKSQRLLTSSPPRPASPPRADNTGQLQLPGPLGKRCPAGPSEEIRHSIR